MHRWMRVMRLSNQKAGQVPLLSLLQAEPLLPERRCRVCRGEIGGFVRCVADRPAPTALRPHSGLEALAEVGDQPLT